jgi:hypothetical protein
LPDRKDQDQPSKGAIMRNAGRLKLGYYPLPIEEARNLRQLLIAPPAFFAVDPCAGDGTALLEITQGLSAARYPCAFSQCDSGAWEIDGRSKLIRT